MNSLDPSLFIGSSTEGLPIAYALQVELDEECEPLVWRQSVFGPTATTISALLERAENSDFAALVFTPDDSVVSRAAEDAVARDNVIFELGLFLGALGPRRVFIVFPLNQQLRPPSDPSGVTCPTHKSHRKIQQLQAPTRSSATPTTNTV